MRKKLDKVLRVLRYDLPVHIILLTTSILPNSNISNRVRGKLLSPFFKKTGKNLKIASGININQINRMVVGDNVYIAHNVWLNASGNIVLGDNVKLGPFSVLTTTDHKMQNGVVSSDVIYGDIAIDNGVWIGSHVVVTKGVNIGSGSIIAAGSVVTKSIPSNCMAAGVPCKLIRTLEVDNE